jgi:hypothetical protein
MRVKLEARTRTRIEELEYAACEALGNELSKQYWDLEHKLVAQAEEPWSDDENGTPLLNFTNTNLAKTEEHNLNVSYLICAPTRVERDCVSSYVHCVLNTHEITYRSTQYVQT